MPPVGRVDITAADAVGSAPITAIELPANGGKPLAEDWQNVAAMALKNDAYRGTAIDGKVAKAGDTMTGKLTISPSTAVQGLQVTAGTGSGQNAIQATGDGIGPAIIGTGGTNGAGASFAAGGGNNFGLRGIGAGNETGGEFTGGTTGTGIRAKPGTDATTTAPTYALDALSGGIRMTTVAAPNANVNPGADATMFPQDMVSSTCIFESDGAGNYAVRNNKGKNVASVAGTTLGVVTVTFVRNLLGNDYRMHLDAEDGYDARWNGVQNVGNFQFVVRDMTTNAVVNLATTAVTISVTTIGF